jgi:hypothetical protein
MLLSEQGFVGMMLHMYITCRGVFRGGSLGLLEAPFWAEIFNFPGDFGQKVVHFHVTALRMPQTYLCSGNL